MRTLRKTRTRLHADTPFTGYFCELFNKAMRNCELIEVARMYNRGNDTWSRAIAVYRAIDNKIESTPVLRRIDDDFPVMGEIRGVDEPHLFQYMLEAPSE